MCVSGLSEYYQSLYLLFASVILKANGNMRIAVPTLSYLQLLILILIKRLEVIVGRGSLLNDKIIR